MLDWETQPHRRRNLLTGEWVLVSPQRTGRPWQGQIEAGHSQQRPSHDTECYLCPGNARAGGHRNPDYHGIFAFDNDFPALVPDLASAAPAPSGDSDLLIAEPERGVCRVLCYSPRHDASLASMSVAEIERVVEAWRVESAALIARPHIRYVQIFENRGPMAGASNPHPHCQIWAGETIPNEIAKEQREQQKYFAQRGSCLLCDYGRLEQGGPRSVYENDAFAVLVPFWAVWPFETLLIGKRHAADLQGLNERGQGELADALGQITACYDRLFGAELAYSMGVHQQPSGAQEGWHLHLHFNPPALRSAAVLKFMVGYEMFAMPQRDLTPESAAEKLRAAMPR